MRCRKSAYLQKKLTIQEHCVLIWVWALPSALIPSPLISLYKFFISFTTLFDVYHDLLNKYCRPSKYTLTYSSFFKHWCCVLLDYTSSFQQMILHHPIILAHHCCPFLLCCINFVFLDCFSHARKFAIFNLVFASRPDCKK